MTLLYKRFPPGLENVWLPLDSRGAALAGIALYPACRPWVERGRGAATLAVRCFGARVLPGSVSTWTPPMTAGTWRSLIERWRREIGSFDSVSLYHTPQPERRGVAVLLVREGTPMAFVKVRDTERDLAREHEALARVFRYDPRAFFVPDILSRGAESGWHYLAEGVVPGFHRAPRKPPVAAIVEEIQEALADLPRDPGVPEHWRPMHGDFTPWNLRLVPRRRRGAQHVLVDWEEAGWGPPAADEMYYRVVERVVTGRRHPLKKGGEEASFWRRRIAGRPAAGRDAALAALLDRQLARVELAGTPRVAEGATP